MNSIEKKIDLNQIIIKMKQKFGEGLSDLEKARYLYIELGKLFRYNLNYLTAYKRKQEDIYFNYVDFDNIPTNSYICVQMSDIYVEALRRVGVLASTEVDVKASSDYTMPHKYTVIQLPDGKNIIADMVYDLAFIQLGMKTSYFATNNENGNKDILSENEIKQIDDRIGYTSRISSEETVYTEYFLDMIKQELDDPEKMKEYVKYVYNGAEYKEENLISYKFDLINRFFHLERMGFKEGSRFLGNLYSTFFSEKEREKISFFLLDYEGYEGYKIGDVEQIACYCFKKGGKDCEYYIYEEGKSLEPIKRERLEERLNSKKYFIIKDKNAQKTEYGDDIFYR